jgi:hypothetical protein
MWSKSNSINPDETSNPCCFAVEVWKKPFAKQAPLRRPTKGLKQVDGEQIRGETHPKIVAKLETVAWKVQKM